MQGPKRRMDPAVRAQPGTRQDGYTHDFCSCLCRTLLMFVQDVEESRTYSARRAYQRSGTLSTDGNA
jgi:hypothetical protein